MARSRFALGVDFAGEETRLALVEVSDSELEVVWTGVAEHSEQLPKLVRSMPKRPSSLVAAVPLEGGALRILDLPPTTQENLDRVVALEAESALPMAGDQVAIGHHVLGMTGQSRLDVLLVAARLEPAQAQLRRLTGLPLPAPALTVSSVALMNALTELRGAEREKTCAILRVEEIGAELLVLEGARPVLSQFVSLDETPPGGSGLEWIGPLCVAVRYRLQAFAYERGTTIDRLYLCGAGPSVPLLERELSRALELQPALVEGPGFMDADGARFAVAFGCAAQAAGEHAGPPLVALNLTPPRLTVAREKEQRRHGLLAWVALLASITIVVGLLTASAFGRKSTQVQRAETQAKDLPSIGVGAGGLQPSRLKRSAEDLKLVQDVRVGSAQAMAAFSKRLPETTWLAEITYNAETGCVVRGFSLSPDGPQAAQFAMLDERLFDEVSLDYRTEEIVAEQKVWGFQLTCKLRPKERTRTRSRARAGATGTTGRGAAR